MKYTSMYTQTVPLLLGSGRVCSSAIASAEDIHV